MEWNEQEYEATLRQFRPRNPRLPEVLIMRPTRRRWWIGAAAAAILLGLLSIPIVRNLRGIDVYAVVEAADGPLVRVIDGNILPVAVGDRIDAGDVVRSEGGNSAVLAMRDGLRFEVRSKSEFRVERADDGVRIFLIAGSLIVHAPVQAAGHLYVRTTDLLVSAVSMSTVFFVSTEFQGSRVAVLEGQVRVRQGAMEKALESGEQLATNPQLEASTLNEEFSWSRNAELYLLRLPQPDTTWVPGPDTREAFDVASVRVSKEQVAVSPCDGKLERAHERFRASRVTLYQLIVTAYSKSDCALARKAGMLSGGPGWLESLLFDVEAVMSEESPSPSEGPRGNLRAWRDWAPWTDWAPGTDSRLEGMIRRLLEDRFKLVIRRETREMPVYALTIAKDGHKLTAPKHGGVKGSMANLVRSLQHVTAMPVLDKTGLKDEFDFPPEFASSDEIAAMSRESLFKAVEDDLGLRLEPIKASVEFFVVERVERPSAN
jgi:uncharacterized protein (TIGR03435 family)